MGFYNGKEQYKASAEIRSIEGFKKQFNKQHFKQCDMKIFAKAIMNVPVY